MKSVARKPRNGNAGARRRGAVAAAVAARVRFQRHNAMRAPERAALPRRPPASSAHAQRQQRSRHNTASPEAAGNEKVYSYDDIDTGIVLMTFVSQI